MTSAANIKQSCEKRFACAMPDGSPEELGRFAKYTRHLFRLLLDPVDSDSVMDPAQWLKKSDLPMSRKIQILKDYERHTEYSAKLSKVKAFIKNEPYLADKACRTINSPSDASKLLVAGLIHACDKKIFGLPYFVKGSNPKTWPDRLRNLFGDGPVLTTDFTAMESHHLGVKAQVVRDVYFYLLSGLDLEPSLLSLLDNMFVGDRDISFAQADVTVSERLMSGAQWTSGANSVLNFALISYIMSDGKADTLRGRTHWVRDNFKGLFEGDDGIFSDTHMNEELIPKLGLKLKFEPVPHVDLAGFCGMYLAPGCCSILKDAHKVLAEFFRLPLKYQNHKDSGVMTMLRARALSYAHMFTDCPIVGPLAHRVLDLTSSLDVRGARHEFDAYKRELLDYAIADKAWAIRPNITDQIRVRFAELFGFEVHEQLYIERCISELDLNGALCDLTIRYTAFDWDALRFLFKGKPDHNPVGSYLDHDHVPPVKRKKKRRKSKRNVASSALPCFNMQVSGKTILF